MRFASSLPGLLAVVALLHAPPPAAGAADADAEKTSLAVEALTRLPNPDLDASPKLKETVLRVLDRTRGTPNFVKLVQHFKLQGQEAGLLEVAINQPAGEAGSDALRLILAGGNTDILANALASTNTPAAVRIAAGLGDTGDKQAVPLLLPLLTGRGRDARLQRQAVRSLVRTAAGAHALLKLAQEGQLDDDLKFTAGAELNAVRWADIKAAAARVLPPPQGQNAEPLPPISELVKLTGDAGSGARVFTNAQAACATCHVVNGRGTELGPNLSEIGAKLGKDALFESILDPSAGVSFGYEAFDFQLNDGEDAYGLIVSETEDEVVLKNTGGIATRLAKRDIASRKQSRLSIMPAGLQSAMTRQELVDLVEYLASLKKP